MATRFVGGTRLTDAELDNLYHEDDMAARICEALPEEALRKGFFLSAGGDHELAVAVHEYEKRLSFPKQLESCAVWARTYGGAVIYLGLEDGLDESEPVNEEAIQTIRFAHVIDKRYITPHEFYEDAENDLKYGEPKTYVISSRPQIGGSGGADSGAVLHESRLIRLDGARTSVSRKVRNNGWSESVLQKVDDVMTQFGGSWQGVTHLLTDAAQGVFKIDGLVDMIAGGDKDILQSRMEVVEMGRSVARALMLDAEKEDFTRVAYTFGGIPDVLKLFIQRLSAAARMPVVVMMGQTPEGLLSGSGERDIRLWYDRVQAYQTNDLTDAITQFYRLVFLAQDFEGGTPEGWIVKFGRLWQMTDEEQATVEKLTAEKDKIYIDAGVILPEEVAVNRFTARGFSAETQIDLEAREEMLAAELELAKEKAGEEPELPMVPGAASEPDTTQEDESRGDAARLDTIRKVGIKFVVFSKDGKKLGEHDTKAAAEKQLRAIEANK
jgi:phage-related protein (TIGR01555 family)